MDGLGSTTFGRNQKTSKVDVTTTSTLSVPSKVDARPRFFSELGTTGAGGVVGEQRGGSGPGATISSIPEEAEQDEEIYLTDLFSAMDAEPPAEDEPSSGQNSWADVVRRSRTHSAATAAKKNKDSFFLELDLPRGQLHQGDETSAPLALDKYLQAGDVFYWIYAGPGCSSSKSLNSF